MTGSRTNHIIRVLAAIGALSAQFADAATPQPNWPPAPIMLAQAPGETGKLPAPVTSQPAAPGPAGTFAPFAPPGWAAPRQPGAFPPAMPQQPGAAPPWGMPGAYVPPPPGMPGPGYAPPGAGAADASPPRVEVEVSDPSPYVEQSLILTVRILSKGNLGEATPALPNPGNAVIRLLDGPRASSRDRGGKREIVNEFRYALTPLESGRLALPPIRVSGTHAGYAASRGPAFAASSAEPLNIEVRPAVAGVSPWLPLYHLASRAVVSTDQRPEAGKPIGFTVEVVAVGATGNQLPSVESGLGQVEDFRVYLEGFDTEGGVTPDGRFLTGRRVERYTLVPQHGGKLHVPALRIPWFNLGLGRAEAAELPIRQIVAEGPPRSGDPARLAAIDIVPIETKWLFWAPMFLLFPLILGYWVMVFSPPPPVRVTSTAAADQKPGRSGALFAFFSRLSPWRLAEWLRPRIARALPLSARLWFCLRIVEREDDPEDWAMLLKFLSAKHLGISAQLPLPELGEQILVHAARKADPARVRLLMQQLDDALYGRKALDDFPGWKRSFRRETRPRLFGRWRARRARRTQLPSLNPTSGRV